MVENLFQIVTKSEMLAPHRYSLTLLKVGCPIRCSEWLPVSKEFYDECAEGEIIQINTKRINMTVDQAHKFMTAHRSKMASNELWPKIECAGAGSGCGIEEYDPQQV